MATIWTQILNPILCVKAVVGSHEQALFSLSHPRIYTQNDSLLEVKNGSSNSRAMADFMCVHARYTTKYITNCFFTSSTSFDLHLVAPFQGGKQ